MVLLRVLNDRLRSTRVFGLEAIVGLVAVLQAVD